MLCIAFRILQQDQIIRLLTTQIGAMDSEKVPGTIASSQAVENIHEYNEREGYLIDSTDGSGTVKLARDGHTRLIPQPSDDPNDPLNWSPFRKHLILFIVSFAALLPDYGSATGAVTLLPQAAQWHMTEDHVNHSQVGNVFMLGAGGLVGKSSVKTKFLIAHVH